MRIQNNMPRLVGVSLLALMLSACGSDDDKAATTSTATPKSVIFFLGDGMGITTLTAARIYAVGEDGELTIDNLPDSAFVRTFSEDGQVTDSAPSMAAYMTGVKMKNEVISMQTGTIAVKPNANGTGNCASDTGNAGKKGVDTLLELAKAQGMGTGVVTTTRITHATPATTYAHVCHRDAESDIAAQMVPGGAGTGDAAFNSKLKDGIDVVLGGGRQFFKTTADGGKREDSRDLVNEMKAKGYSYVSSGSELALVNAGGTSKLLGLFSSGHMNYDLDRTNKNINEPSLSQMTGAAIDVLKAKNKPFFLMVEGGRIDHALHDTNAKRALQDTKAFDDAIRLALSKVDLKNTLIVVTADHDHTLVMNGYAKRTGKYVPGVQTSVLGLVKNYNAPGLSVDGNGNPYPIIGFGNGKKRPENNRGDDRVTSLTDSDDCNAVAGPTPPAGKTYTNTYGGTFWCTGAASDDFQQEAVVQTGFNDAESHGGTDVFLGAAGAGSEEFHGSLENIEVFGLVRKAIGL